MIYFCRVHVQSKANQERMIYVVMEDIADGIVPELTKEVLQNNNQYKDFCAKYKPKFILAEYTMYSTDEKVYASTQDEVFEQIITDNKCQVVSRSELRFDKTANRSRKGKKKVSAYAKFGIVLGAILIAFGAFTVGNLLGKKKSAVSNESIMGRSAPNEDGMIIPEQVEIADDAQQITVSIDRSYAAVPTEDIQLKGEVVDGKATITLPEFDKTDFFTHVSGYTWGFTTNPNGKKIEYYGGNTYEFIRDTKLYRVLVKYGGGSGTKNDPYIIDYYDQLELMGEEKARGYFKQTADIEFPEWASHSSIDTVNELKKDPEDEYFEYDGNGFKISNLGSPLFGKVSGATIKNVNITNSVISSAEYKNYGFIVCEAYNYSYTADADKTTYETGETLIQHCTVSHSQIRAEYPKSEDEEETVEVVTAAEVVPPDLIEYDEDGNVIEKTPSELVEPTKSGEYCIGAISGLGGQIENCYVTDFGVYSYLDDYFLYVGCISGKPSNVINSVAYNCSAMGNIFTAGGIAGNCGGSKLYNAIGQELPTYYGGNIKGCAARTIYIESEVAAGGIAGEGSSNAESPLISNCYTKELTFSVGVYKDSERAELKKTGIIGGVIGVDGTEENGHTIMNTVSCDDYYPIGDSRVSKYDDTIRLAPDYAYYQENILTVINKNTITPKKPKEIFTGSFKFSDSSVFGDDSGALAYPAEIVDLFEKTITENETNTTEESEEEE